MRFELGNVVMTRGIAARIRDEGLYPPELMKALARHAEGDWGEALCIEDVAANDSALADGGRLLSAYQIGGIKVWIITEWDRSATTILLPAEY